MHLLKYSIHFTFLKGWTAVEIKISDGAVALEGAAVAAASVDVDVGITRIKEAADAAVAEEGGMLCTEMGLIYYQKIKKVRFRLLGGMSGVGAEHGAIHHNIVLPASCLLGSTGLLLCADHRRHPNRASWLWAPLNVFSLHFSLILLLSLGIL